MSAGAAGDTEAWAQLVVRFEHSLRGVARFHGLSASDTEDVIQTTWLRFVEHGRGVRDPQAIGGWLRTTARRESLRVLQAHIRERPTDDSALGDSADPADACSGLFAAERRAALHDALEELPNRHRQLMTLLVAEPDLSYEEAGDRLGMPVGSIGPIRARCLARLRRSPRLQAVEACDA